MDGLITGFLIIMIIVFMADGRYISTRKPRECRFARRTPRSWSGSGLAIAKQIRVTPNTGWEAPIADGRSISH
jgi:hypothetical protein